MLLTSEKTSSDTSLTRKDGLFSSSSLSSGLSVAKRPFEFSLDADLQKKNTRVCASANISTKSMPFGGGSNSEKGFAAPLNKKSRAIVISSSDEEEDSIAKPSNKKKGLLVDSDEEYPNEAVNMVCFNYRSC